MPIADCRSTECRLPVADRRNAGCRLPIAGVAVVGDDGSNVDPQSSIESPISNPSNANR
jgi:hypothetical protein